MLLTSRQMTDMVDFLLDRVKSPRFDDTMKFMALNMAQDKVINDRYDNFKKNRGVSFQSIQRVRDELYTIVVDSAPVSIVNNKAQFPPDYRDSLNLDATVDGITRDCKPITYDESLIINDDPHDYPSMIKPRCPYVLEAQDGMKVFHGGTNFTSATLSYIRQPKAIGISSSTFDYTTTFNVGDSLLVTSGYVVYNGNTYNVDDEFTIITGITSFTGTGLVVKMYNCELPQIVHMEVCEIAASILAGNTEDYNKKQVIEVEKERS